MDLNFEQMLAEHNQNYKDAEVFNNWMPPDNEYIVSLVKLDKGSTTKDGVSALWWKLTGRIEDVQDEKLNGEEFTVGYYTSKAYGILKGAVKSLTGELIDDLGAAHLALTESIGKIIRVKVATSFSDKYKKDFTNCYIQEVLDATEEASAEDVSNVTDPAPIEAPAVVLAEVPAEAPSEPPREDSEGERQAIPE